MGEEVGIKAIVEETATGTETLLPARSNGTIPILLAIDSIRGKLSIPPPFGQSGGPIEVNLDSDGKNVHISDKEFSCLDDEYRALRGWSYTLVLAPDHTFVAVEGIRENLARLPELPAKAAGILRERFEDLRAKARVRVVPFRSP